MSGFQPRRVSTAMAGGERAKFTSTEVPQAAADRGIDYQQDIPRVPLDRSEDTAGPGGEVALGEANCAEVDSRAFAALYQRYLARVYRYLRTRTSSDEDAADLTQQVFANALDGLPKYQDRGLPFAAWLFRIARNVVVDHRRRRRDTIAWDSLPEALHPTDQRSEGCPEAAVLRQEDLERLRDLLVRLDPDQRELLALRFAGGLTALEIAALVGKSEAAVRKQVARLLQTLKGRYHDA